MSIEQLDTLLFYGVRFDVTERHVFLFFLFFQGLTGARSWNAYGSCKVELVDVENAKYLAHAIPL